MKFTKEMREKAIASRAANLVAAQHYKRDWLDSDLWDSLAKTRAIRLPVWSKAPTPSKLNRWHSRLDKETFRHVYGASAKRLIELNPHVPLRAFVGQMLERWQEQAV